MNLYKNTILIYKKDNSIRYKIVEVISSRLFRVRRIDKPPLMNVYNYDRIWRDFHVKDPIHILLKKL